MKPVRGLVRGAFSLVELLVVVAMIATLIALLIPAVQRVRAAASLAHCANNMKQIGPALHNHHDVYGCFPSHVVNDFASGVMPYGWLYHILPYLGQDAVYKQGRFDPASLGDPTNALHDEAAAIWAKTCETTISMYLCPTEARDYAGGIAHDGLHQGGVSGLCAMTSYLGVAGKSWEHSNGVFALSGISIIVLSGSVKITHITDGLSNTLMVGERPPSPDNSFGWWSGYYADSLLLAIEGPFFGDSKGDSSGTPCPDRSYFSPGDINNYCDANHFWSLHSGGGNWLLCDGSVRFMPYSAGTTVIPPMATISGGEVVPPLE
jgi:prepilin-type processing-associated H-X9-DG protein